MHGRHISSHWPPRLDGHCLSGRHTVLLCLCCAGHTQAGSVAQCAGPQSTAALGPILNPRAALCAALLAWPLSDPTQRCAAAQRAREKDREREKDRQRDMERERARYIKADLEGHDSDDDREPWQRRSLRHS